MIAPHLLTTLALALDTDGDRLADAVEGQLGTDPTRFDSDGDTLSDGAEVVVLHTNPGRNDALDCASFVRVPIAAGAMTGPFAAYQDLAAGDLDGDLDPDVVVIREGELRWHERRDDATFAEHALTDAAAVRVRVADLDADGDLEVVYQLDGAPGWIATLHAVGDRRFVPGPLQSVMEGDVGPTDLELGDLDGDGLPDLVAANGGSGAGWYRNLGSGVFGPRREVYGGDVGGVDGTTIELADLDADGDLDVVGASTYGDGLGWTINQGGGRFGRFQRLTWAGAPEIAVALEIDDLDGDGLPDITFAGSDGTFRPVRVDWLRNTGGGFTFVRTLANGVHGPVVTADPDGDGDRDLVVGGEELRWLENRSPGVFGPARRVVARSAGGVVPVDLDGDGKEELVAAGADLDLYLPALGDPDRDGLDTVLEACLTGTDPRLGDTDGGGALDGHDLLELADPIDPGDDPPTGADADGDGLGDDLERLVLGTAPALADTDADRLDDGDEVLVHRSDPRSDDGDLDGALDELEVRLGLDPNARDGDGDHLDDGVDLVLADPLLADTDGDGTPDGDEVRRFGTDPATADPDGDLDGLADPVELALGTAPTSRDTDGDGLLDGEEVWALDLRPGEADTDGDGAPDGAEVHVLGTDPLLDEASCASAPVPSALASSAEHVVAGDMDLDGDDDLVLSGAAAAWREVLPDGTLGAEHAIDPSRADAVPVDLDGDGDLDVVLAALELAWAENLGGGVFAPKVVVDASAHVGAESVLPFDVDGDGWVDLVTSTSAPRISLYRNVDGTFGGRRVLATPRQETRLVPWDHEADGDTDVLLVSGPPQWSPTQPNTVSVLPNVGGGFGPIAPIGVGGLIAVIDLDTDGDDDLVVYDDAIGLVGSLENLGAAGLGAPVPQNVPHGWDLLTALDVDGDGDEDLSSGERWLENDGGRIGRGHPIPSIHEAWETVIAVHLDVDRDGDPDTFVAAQLEAAVTPNTLGDLDGDGLSEETEVCLAATDPARPDTDAGGTPDGRELLDLTDPAVPGDDLP